MRLTVGSSRPYFPYRVDRTSGSACSQTGRLAAVNWRIVSAFICRRQRSWCGKSGVLDGHDVGDTAVDRWQSRVIAALMGRKLGTHGDLEACGATGAPMPHQRFKSPPVRNALTSSRCPR